VFERLRTLLLRWMLVPAAPGAPSGSPESVRIFRAGRNFYRLALVKWGLAQVAVAVPLFVAVSALGPFYSIGIPARVWPEWAKTVWYAAEFAAVAVFLLQLPLSYAAVRLNYEMRWYIVTDRSLRIRSGIWSVAELTMTFANIQQVNLTQGPLERMLGLADLEVTSAGGGKAHGKEGGKDSHAGRFEGVDDAKAIRDLILDRLRHYRDAGLGDPDEAHAPTPDAQHAALEVLLEVQRLRAVL